MGTYEQLVGMDVPTRQAAALLGLSRTTIYRKPAMPEYCEPVEPPNKLSTAERAEILAALNSPEFVDLAPLQVYTKLLDAGIYLGSVSTFYRVLQENKQVKERRALAKHPARAIPELVATAPGQVLSWDITKLAGPIKGKYFDCYLMIDIHSRFIVGAHVHATESAVLAVEMMKEIFGIHGVPQVVHADRGTSMTSKTVAALLSDLEVTRSHSRPRVSNDNPYKDLFDAAGISYMFVDITSNDAALEYISEDLGYAQAPVVLVEIGGTLNHWSGLNPPKIQQAIALELAA